MHFMGVCGVGMAGVAWLMRRGGCRVSGCDGLVNAWAGPLREAGIAVAQGHDPAHAGDADCLVVTPAVPPDHPELRAARALGIPVVRRGEALAGLMAARRGVAVCGTHGKTTTACFATRLLQELGERPEWCIGGATPRLGFVAGAPEETAAEKEGAAAGTDTAAGGKAGRLLVAEADESDGTLALYRPEVLVLTNLDADHLDHFRDEEDLRDCFRRAVGGTRGGVAVCRDHPAAWDVGSRAAVPVVGFGFSPEAELRASGLRCTERGTEFTASFRGFSAEVSLPVPGRHNVLNALGAAAAAILLGHSPEGVLAALPRACAELPGRRFETVSAGAGIRVVADYAHHPAELRRAVETALLFRPGRLRVFFQPHRYTRTLALRDRFPGAFRGADEVVLLPVYAASERPVPGGGAGDLYAAFRAAGAGRVLLARSIGEAFAHAAHTARPGDFFLIAGAGDVIALADLFRGGAVVAAGGPGAGAAAAGVSLAPYSFFRAGGAALGVRECPDEAAFVREMGRAAGDGVPRRVSGMGSNSWFSDLFWPGVVVRQGPGEGPRALPDGTVEAPAGMKGGALLDWMEERGLGGLAFMDSIPGTVGGWLAMNAGTRDGCIGDRVKWIRRLNPGGKVAMLSHSLCGFGYRGCAALREGPALSCGLSAAAAAPGEIRAARLAARAKRIPLAGLRTCGSVFRNPPGDAAGRLLDAAGCRGLRVGGARVAAFHANVIAADPGASASDVLALALIMRNRVRESAGVELEPEISGLDFRGIY